MRTVPAPTGISLPRHVTPPKVEDIDGHGRDPAVIDKAATLLKGICPYITNFHSSQYINDLANGDICLALGWSGDVLQAKTRADEERFMTARWGTLATGAPVLLDAVSAFDCRLVATHDVASHRILIGEVVGLGGEGRGAGLIYRQRRFGSV